MGWVGVVDVWWGGGRVGRGGVVGWGWGWGWWWWGGW